MENIDELKAHHAITLKKTKPTLLTEVVKGAKAPLADLAAFNSTFGTTTESGPCVMSSQVNEAGKTLELGTFNYAEVASIPAVLAAAIKEIISPKRKRLA